MNLNIKDLRKKNHRLLKIVIAIIATLVAIESLLLFVLKKEISAVSTMKQTAVQLQAENASVSQTKNFLIQQKTNISQFEKVLPSDEELVDFVKTVEDIAKGFTDNATLRFVSTKPVKEKNNLFVPFTLQFKTQLSQVVPFLRRFERIAYLTQVTALELKQGAQEEVTLRINAKVYVQNSSTK